MTRRSILNLGLPAAAMLMSMAPLSAGAENIEFGMVESLTGPTAFYGKSNLCGAEVAVSAMNATGSTGGRTIVLKVEDDQSTPATATQAASKLTGAGIKFFVGGASSNTVLAEIPVFKDAKALFTGGTSRADEVMQSGGLVVRINSNNAQDGAIIAKYVSDKLQAKNLVMVTLQSAYGEGALASIRKGLGPNVTVKNQYFAPADTTNFQSVLTSVTADSPDAVVFALFGAANVAYMRQYKQFALKAPSIAAVGVLSSTLAIAAGGAADGLISADQWIDSLDNPANKALKAAFDKFKGNHASCKDVPLDKLVATTYAQVLLLAQAIDKAKSIDPATVRNTIIAGKWDLPMGTTEFGPDGQAKAQYYMTRVKGFDIVAAPDLDFKQ